MTREKEVTEKVARIIDQAVGDKKARRRPKITCPPPGSGTSRQCMIQGDTKNIPIERPYIWLIVDEKNLSLVFQEFDSYINPSVPMKVRHSGVKLSRQNRDRECLITKQMGESGLPLGENFLAKTVAGHRGYKL